MGEGTYRARRRCEGGRPRQRAHGRRHHPRRTSRSGAATLCVPSHHRPSHQRVCCRQAAHDEEDVLLRVQRGLCVW